MLFSGSLWQDLRTQLQASSATWRIVVGHHPVFSTGEHGSTPELVEHILPLLKVGAAVTKQGEDKLLELRVSRLSEAYNSGSGVT